MSTLLTTTLLIISLFLNNVLAYPIANNNYLLNNNNNTINNFFDKENNSIIRQSTNKNYLYETDPKYKNTYKFITSKYYKDRTGIDIDELMRLGDNTVELEYIKRTQIDITKEINTKILFNQTEYENRIQELTNNGIEYILDVLLKDDNYQFGDKLTREQLKLITKDILIYEYQTINGQKVLVPTIYYAYNPQDDLYSNNSTKDNRSTIQAGNKAQITVGNNIINSGNIKAGNSLVIKADNDIINRGGTIQTNSDDSLLKLIAGNNITNEAIINSNTFKTKSHGKELTNIYSNLVSKGNIKSNGNNSSIILNADKDINILGSNIETKGNASDIILQSENGNVNILAEQVYNRMEDYNKSKSFMSSSETHQIEDSLKNISSNINSNGNLSIITKGSDNNLNVLGSILNAKEDINLESNGNINILNVKDSEYKYYYNMLEKTDLAGMATSIATAVAAAAIVTVVTGGVGTAALATTTGATSMASAGISAAASGSQMKKGSITIKEDYDETIINSILNANNINIKSEDDLNIQSSELNATNKKSFDVKNNINITEDTELHDHTYSKEKFGGDLGKAALGGAMTGLTAAAGVYGSEHITNTILSTTFTSYTSAVGNSMSNVLLNGGNLKDALKTGVKSLTDKDIVKNSITSGITSGITKGLNEKLNANVGNEFTKALKEATASTISNTAVESTLNKRSFGETLRDQVKTSFVMAGANLTAKEIGKAAHGSLDIDKNGNIIYNEPTIGRTKQLLLHGVVGATSSKLLGNDAVSGAVSSIIGEVTGELLGNSLYGTTDSRYLTEDRKTMLKEMGGLAGGLSSLVTGGLRGLSSEEISSNVFNGQRLGKNAVENNYLLKTGQVEKGDTLKSITKEINDFYGTNLTEEDLVKINAIADENNLTIGDVIAAGTVSENGEVWRVPYDKNEVNLDYLKNNMKGEKEKILNYHRFVFEDDDLPQTENELLKKEKNSWEGGKVAPAHNVGTSGNIEYRGIGNRTGQQIIFDKNGNIVTTPENKGTYDYVVPKVKVASPLDTYKSLKNHNLYDVNPWIKYGNSAKDKSTKQQRKDGLRENKAGKVGNMMWGDN